MDRKAYDMKCPECGMAYVRESPTDRRQHRTYHDEIVNGVPARPLKSETVVWRKGDDRIVVVTAVSAKAWRVRAGKVGRLANQEMHYDFGLYNENEPSDERDIHLFIYCCGSRAIGLAIFERRRRVCHYTWEEFDHGVQKTLEEQDPIWSLGFNWIHKKYRRSGLAKILFHESISHLGVRIDDIGLYNPFSSEGKAWARSVFQEGFLIAK